MEIRSAAQARQKPADASLLTGQERHGMGKPPQAAPAPEHKAVGYGLPCSNCRAYYPADLDVCPICKSPERVSPGAVAGAVPVAPTVANPVPGAHVEDERERFLKELKSQAFATHTQINAAATFRCVIEQNHNGDFEPAAVCHTCYGDVRQQADRLEAALHMDVKEAAQIVYSAVWADTSDPSKTYLNAAAALLSELRKRAGIGLLLGSHQPLAH
ncbi:MAG: hypothetical protein WAQ52_12485 [Terriglobales bacterium]